MSNLGHNLEQARVMRGFTQDQIASAIGLSRPTYALVEAGRRDITLSQAESLAAMLRVTIDELRGAPDGIGTFTDMPGALEKYKQIILNALYFGADEDGKTTKTKLAKLVYLADFTWYYKELKPMSGMSYRKLPQGPVPDVYFRAIDELIEDGTLTLTPRSQAFMLEMSESGDAPSSRLNSEERALIAKIGEAWKGKQTREIVDFTHQQLPWQICRDGEVIPYGLITQEEPERVYGSAEL
jgi:DNA-binding XRE family transcriptional regulator/uncharacterized phage-associated protein